MNYTKLKDELNLACKSYYLLKNPIMTDLEYDNKFRELLSLEKEQGFADDDSPTQKVGYSGLNNEKEHLYGKVLSLDNVYNIEELSNFFKGHVDNLVVMPKLDGLAMVLYYSDGKLQKALLRGDGIKGADVTSLAIQMSGVPLTIEIKESIRIVGEIVCFHTNWASMYKNHRNYVVGSMNLVNETKFKERGLSFVSFDSTIKNVNSFSEKLDVLASISGIIGIPYTTSIDNFSPEELRIKFRNDFFPYCDGLVYAQNNLSILPGNTEHHPYNKVAYKFPPVQLVTKLIDVTWQVGRTKLITPVAIVEDVILDGATVNRASICNLANITSRDIAIGDDVLIHKAGEIIPQILRSVHKPVNRVKITITNCPKCGHEVHVENTGTVYCKNPGCQGGKGAGFNHFVKALEIKGIGKTISEQLAKTMDIIDLLECDDVTLCENSSIAEKNAKKVIESIEKAKKQPRWKAWVGLGIPTCGNSLCQKLPVNSLFDLSYEKLVKIPKVGDKTTNNIMTFISENKELIEKIEAYFTNVEFPKQLSNPTGPKVYITGKLSKPRTIIQKELIEAGFIPTTTLSRSTNILIAGVGAKQEKIDKARELGIKIVREGELFTF